MLRNMQKLVEPKALNQGKLMTLITKFPERLFLLQVIKLVRYFAAAGELSSFGVAVEREVILCQLLFSTKRGLSALWGSLKSSLQIEET